MVVSLTVRRRQCGRPRAYVPAATKSPAEAGPVGCSMTARNSHPLPGKIEAMNEDHTTKRKPRSVFLDCSVDRGFLLGRSCPKKS